MSGDQFNRRRGARAIAISDSVGEARRRLMEHLLIGAAVAASLIQGAWLVHLTMRTIQP